MGAGGPYGYDPAEVAYIRQMLDREKKDLIDQLRLEQQKMMWQNQWGASIQAPAGQFGGGLSGAGLQSGQISLNSLQQLAGQISAAQGYDVAKSSLKTLSDKIRQLDTAEPVKIPNPGPPMPDYIGTLTGWRGWRISDDGKLMALGATQVWEPRKAEPAICTNHKNHRGISPVKDCKCGYWTFKDRTLLEAALTGYATSVRVIGTVELWGRVVECANGWRAQFAYPKELWLLESGLESLSWQYGVPVRRI